MKFMLDLLVILIRKSNYCTIVAVNLFLLPWLLSESAIYCPTSVEIKIIVELIQPQESKITLQ